MCIEERLNELTVAIQDLASAVRHSGLSSSKSGIQCEPCENAKEPAKAETQEEKDAKKAYRAELVKKAVALGIKADAKVGTERLEKLIAKAEAEDDDEDEAPKAKSKKPAAEEDDDEGEGLTEAVKEGIAVYVDEFGKKAAGELIQKCGASTIKGLTGEGLAKLHRLLVKSECISE